MDRSSQNSPTNDNEMEPADSVPDTGTVRRIDAGVLNFKLLFIAILVLLISAVTYLFFNDINFDVVL